MDKRPVPNDSDMRQQLLHRMRDQAASAQQLVDSATESKETWLPALAQVRLWFLAQLLGDRDTSYNSPFAFQLTGDVCVKALRMALRSLVGRHDSLRMVFREKAGIPRVHLLDPYDALCLHDLRSHSEKQKKELTQQIQFQHLNESFALGKGPLFRVQMLLLTDQQSLLLFNIHHIISDGWSRGIMLGDLSRLYRTTVIDEDDKLETLAVNYLEYAESQRHKLESGQWNKQLDYWRSQLGAMPASLRLPFFTRKNVMPGKRSSLPVCFSRRLSQRLFVFARRHHVTPFMVLMAGLQLLLHRYTDQDDISVGTPIAGRREYTAEKILGLFMNTVVIRSRLFKNVVFSEFLQQIKSTVLAAMENQDVPFDVVVETLKPDRKLSGQALFQVMLAWQNVPRQTLEIPGTECVELVQQNPHARLDLSLILWERDDRIAGNLVFADDRVDSGAMERMIGHLQILLAAAIEHPENRIDALPLLSPAERQQQYVRWIGPRMEYPREKTLDRLIVEQALRTPKRIAYQTEHDSLTYRQFNQLSDALAARLQDSGVKKGDLIPVIMPNCLQLPVTWLAIIKCGAAFVPLNPQWPRHRLNQVIAKLPTPVLLGKASAFAGENLEHKILEPDLGELARLECRPRPVDHTGEDTLYVVFTSGSTGEPKGAMNTHRGLVNSLYSRTHWFDTTCDDVVLQTVIPSFDPAVVRLFWMPILGGRVVIPTDDLNMNPRKMVEMIHRYRVSFIGFITSALKVLLDYLEENPQQVHRLASLNKVTIGGEVVDPITVNRMIKTCPHVSLSNIYGPSEAAVGSVAYRIETLTTNSVPIGKPLHNSLAVILDRTLQPVPVGVPGELLLGGDCLGSGYFNDPEQTAKSFIKNPIAELGVERLYRTGDLVCQQTDGNIRFLGRLDQQVKIRGRRIELSEIETHLLKQAAIKACIVRLVGSQEQSRIAAYLVLEAGSAMTEDKRIELRQHLQQNLPDYMLPDHYIQMTAFPCFANGKIDYGQLPRPVQTVESPSIIPLRGTGKRLAQLWQEHLAVENLHTDSDYFALGGHSLLAVKLAAAISHTFAVEVPVAWLFEHPTIGALAARIDEQRAAAGDPVPVQPGIEDAHREITV